MRSLVGNQLDKSNIFARKVHFGMEIQKILKNQKFGQQGGGMTSFSKMADSPH